MERAAGIEPACLTWKDSALPLSYARLTRRISPKNLHEIKLIFRNRINYLGNLKYLELI